MIDRLRQREIQEFIKTHEHDDPAALVLSASRYPDIPIQLVAAQIQSRQKAKSKLPTLYAHEDIVFPHGVSLEQCSSELTAEYKSDIITGDSITDLTGGFGIDAYYFSRKAKRVYYVEQNKELTDLVCSNFQILNPDISCHVSTAEEYLSSESSPTAVYYIDPARRDEHNQKVFKLEDCQPDLSVLLPELQARKSTIWTKLSPMLDIHQVIKTLPDVTEIHVVSVENECKELLLKIEPSKSSKTKVIATNLFKKKRKSVFEFTYEEESQSPRFDLPKTYLYEPNSSIMKAGGFNSIAHRFQVDKLHRNSHLYTSDELLRDFPGRMFKVVESIPLSKKKLNRVLTSNQVNISVRNYPQDVATIRKKLSLKEGGTQYLFATTLMSGVPSGILCERVDIN